MKKILCIVMILAMIMGTITTLTGCGGDNSKKEGTVTLKLSHYYTDTHACKPLVDEFMKRIEEETKDTTTPVVFEVYPGEQLGKASDQFDLVSSGTADIATTLPTFDAGKVPLASVTDLPYYSDSVKACELMWETFAQSDLIQAEYEKYNLRPLAMIQTVQKSLISTKKVDSVDDLKGMVISTSGGPVDETVAAYGAAATVVSPNDLYDSLQKGIIEGCALGYGSIRNYNVAEVASYGTVGLKFGGGSQVYAINLDAWNKLDEDAQKAILDISKDITMKLGEAWDKSEAEGIEFAKENGMEIFEVPQTTEWTKPLNAIDGAWVELCMNAGASQGDAEETLELFKKLSKELGSNK